MPPAAHEQAFLDDIVAHPDDPSVWLILADYLDDRNDPRGELVRLTWQLQYEPDHADFTTREARVQALLAGGVRPVRPRRMLAGIEFAWVPPGSFLMGSPTNEAERKNEKLHRVTLSAGFWMGVYPITQAQWEAVLGDNPAHFAPGHGGWELVRDLPEAERARLPAEQISWEMAADFCARAGHGFRLPTEAQWEYACRAGTTTAFHFGAGLNGHQANCNGRFAYGTSKGTSLRRTAAVGGYPPNAWGLCDLHGNVWEWCQDNYHKAPQRLPAVDPVCSLPPGQVLAVIRVLRGGAWNSKAISCRSAYRLHFRHNYRHHNLGLRVIVSGIA